MSKKGIGIAPNAAIDNNTDTHHSLDTSEKTVSGKTEMEAGSDR